MRRAPDGNGLNKPHYTFGNLRLDGDGTLLRGSEQIHLPPKELAALRFLLERAGQIVTPLDLKTALWGDVHVTADSVPRCVSSLRTALLPDECIQTVYKRGYRMAVPVQRHGHDSSAVPRLAIMPFATGFNMESYMGAALAEETIARLCPSSLGAPSAFSLVARDSVFALAEKGQTAQQLGQTLAADLVLTGTLRALPEHYRLRVEMIRVEDAAQVWVEDFLVAKSQLTSIEDQLAERLASRLAADSLDLASMAAPAAFPVEEPARREAYEKLLRGRQELETFQRHRIQDGLQDLLRATELDPSLIPAQIALVNVCISQAKYGFMSPAMAAEQVRRVARSLPEGTASATSILPALGWVRFHVDHNLAGALKAFSESAQLSYDPWTTRARVLFALGRHRFDEAIGLLNAALAEDPYSPWLHARLAWALHMAEQPDKSREQIEHALELFPAHESGLFYGGMILAFTGAPERAVSLAEELVRRSPYCDAATAVEGYALARAGRTNEAAAIVERLQWASRERYVATSLIAPVSNELGAAGDAIAALRAAEDSRCPWFFQMLADPRLKSLRTHPEFKRMANSLTAMEAAAAHEEEAAMSLNPQ